MPPRLGTVNERDFSGPAPTKPHAVTPYPAATSVLGRSRAAELAPRDPVAALRIARDVHHAWYRIQSLAFVVDHIDARYLAPVLEEASRTADNCHDAYGTAAVVAWPIAAAWRRGQRRYAERKRCLERAAAIELPNSQAMRWRSCGRPAMPPTPSWPSRSGVAFASCAIPAGRAPLPPCRRDSRAIQSGRLRLDHP